jgi:hypothetical protein
MRVNTIARVSPVTRRIGRALRNKFGDETTGCDIRQLLERHLASDYGRFHTDRQSFDSLTIADAAEAVDRLVSPEDAIRIALALQ